MAATGDVRVTIRGDATELRRELEDIRAEWERLYAGPRRARPILLPPAAPWADLHRWQREQPWYRRAWYAIRGKALLP